MVPGIRIAGLKFVTPSGARIPKVGVSDFALFKRWRMPSGQTALVEPRLQEWHTLANTGGYSGPITLRVFRHAANWNAFGINPNEIPQQEYQASLRAFVEYVSSRPYRQFYVELTGGDAQVLWPSNDGNEADPGGLVNHLNVAAAAIVDLPVWFEELNERWKNGRAYGVSAPQWGSTNPLIRASGYYADTKVDWPDSLRRDYIVFHTDRTVNGMRWPKLLYDMPSSIAVLHGYFGVPVDLNEPFRFDEAGDPAWAELMGSLIAWTAGVLLHTVQGRDGNGFQSTPVQQSCVARFFKGAAAGVQLNAL